MMIIRFENGITYKLEHVIREGENRLLYGLAQEYTPLGRAFVDSIWYKKQVEIFDIQDENCMMAEAEVWKCYITGSLFARVLSDAKMKDPEADYSAVWEIKVLDWKQIEANEAAAIAVSAIEPETGDVIEYHLDHPYYKR